MASPVGEEGGGAGALVWTIEQVVALAGSSARFGAGEALAVPSRWSQTGAGDRAVWGRYHGSGSEPYDIAVDHVDVATRCTCPSRAHPCKHVVGLLVLWVRGHLAAGPELASVAGWIDHRRSRRVEQRAEATASDGPNATESRHEEQEPSAPPADTAADDADKTRNDRIDRLLGGLVELDRWLEDRLRSGLADPGIARFATWDELARRLTDARAGALANRIRRLAGRVGAEPDWHEHVLAEIGLLHLLAQAGQRIGQLPAALADGVAVACGWQVRKADVVASVPETDHWLVAGRSDTREDLVEVRRVWLRGVRSGAWAMVLSFAAYRQALDTSLTVGTVLHADLHRYPGAGQRALVGSVSDVDAAPVAAASAALRAASSTVGVCELVGAAVAAEPWVERVPAVVTVAITRGDGGWVLTDGTGSLLIARESARSDAVATLLAVSNGRPVTIAIEWTPRGVVPLTVFLDDRALDVGPRADESFVGAA